MHSLLAVFHSIPSRVVQLLARDHVREHVPIPPIRRKEKPIALSGGSSVLVFKSYV